MNKKIIIYIVVILVVIISIGTFYLSRSSKTLPKGPMQTNTEQTPSSTVTDKTVPAKTYNISAVNFSFNPGILNINKGDTIIWTNQDSAPHQIAGGDLNGPVMSKGQSYTFVFNNVGTFNYHCAIHPSMTGTVIVK